MFKEADGVPWVRDCRDQSSRFLSRALLEVSVVAMWAMVRPLRAALAVPMTSCLCRPFKQLPSKRAVSQQAWTYTGFQTSRCTHAWFVGGQGFSGLVEGFPGKPMCTMASSGMSSPVHKIPTPGFREFEVEFCISLTCKSDTVADPQPTWGVSFVENTFFLWA